MKFKDKYDLPFTLLADPDHSVAEHYGVWGEKKYMGKTYMGVSRRRPHRAGRDDREGHARFQARNARRRRARGAGDGLVDRAAFCDASRVLTWFRSLFRRREPREASPIREEDAYARSYGERSGEIVSVVRMEPQRIPRWTGTLTGELVRPAFEARLDSRGKAAGT